jgi:hypothetical protein
VPPRLSLHYGVIKLQDVAASGEWVDHSPDHTTPDNLPSGPILEVEHFGLIVVTGIDLPLLQHGAS